MAGREVNERDFRMPEFRDAKVEDYEFRSDGTLARKDRWERAIGSIRHMVGINGREFEIPDVVAAVRQLAATFEGWVPVAEDSKDRDDWPNDAALIEIRLDDGSILRHASYVRGQRWVWNGADVPLRVVAWREQLDMPQVS